MIPRIAVLPDEVIDQIAAGEVVERPASVVKELLENAIDAGATRIDIELEDGGKRLVRVADNGAGMTPEDAARAVARHATSKIGSVSDLVGIASYGFRGEALPAIGSVSRLQLESSADGREGTRVRITGGRVDAIEPCARRRGSTVAVRGLFFNTPARRKFLRAARTETRATLSAIQTLALARPDIGIRVVRDGRVVLDVAPGHTVEQRVVAAWGKRVAATLLPLDAREGNLSIRGFIQRPAEASPAGRRAQLFINQRPFRDHFLVRAAEEGYLTTIAPGNRPSMLLYLELPGDGVDVNVHPTKLEVRFRDRRWIERVVTDAVRAALGGVAAAPGVPVEQAFAAGQWSAPSPSAVFGSIAGAPRRSDAQATLFGAEAPGVEFGACQPDLLQVFETYIVFATDADIAIVDQHSAHERVLYERAMGALTGGGSNGQRLLLPLTLDLAPAELEAVEEHLSFLVRLGYEIEPFGGRSIVVHCTPNPHPRFDAKRCLEELAADLAGGRLGAWSNRVQRFAATFACRAAIKAGQRLDDQEMRELLDALMLTELPPHDVHGRPTIVRLPRDELERRFGRR